MAHGPHIFAMQENLVCCLLNSCHLNDRDRVNDRSGLNDS
jgi:hypothetical protein